MAQSRFTFVYEHECQGFADTAELQAFLEPRVASVAAGEPCQLAVSHGRWVRGNLGTTFGTGKLLVSLGEAGTEGDRWEAQGALSQALHAAAEAAEASGRQFSFELFSGIGDSSSGRRP